MKKLIYTFRTNFFKEEMKKEYSNIIIMGKLKEDLEKIKLILFKNKPKFIIGCAKADRSCIEKLTINKFNKNKVSKGGKNSYKLFVPKNKLFILSKKDTSSFCNWTMYKVSEFIQEDKLKTKLIFIHFKKEDFEKLKLFIKEIK